MFSPGLLVRGQLGEDGQVIKAVCPLCFGDHLMCLALWEGFLSEAALVLLWMSRLPNSKESLLLTDRKWGGGGYIWWSM